MPLDWKLSRRGRSRPYDLFRAELPARDWRAVRGGLADFWVKLCDLLGQYYGGGPGDDWDRIVFLYDEQTGHLSTLLAAGGACRVGRVHLSLHIPLAGRAYGRLPDPDLHEREWNKAVRALVARVRAAVVESASAPSAAAAIKRLLGARRFQVYFAEGDDTESMKRLAVGKRTDGRRPSTVKASRSKKPPTRAAPA